MKTDTLAAEFANLAAISARLDALDADLARSRESLARSRAVLDACGETLAASRAASAARPSAGADCVAFLSSLALAHAPAAYRPIYLAAAEEREAARRAAVFSAAVSALASADL